MKRLLVVDDNADAANILGELLREIGHVVAVAYDSETAIELAKTFKPAIALLDIGLPMIDGYELARRLRASDRDLRLIAITGHREPKKSLAAGFDLHLGKPVDFDELEAAIATLDRDET
jgi:CheY-like chemotaxis protein